MVATPKTAQLFKIDSDLTINTARDTAAALLSLLQDKKDLEIDLSAVSEIDSAGLQLLIAAKRAATAAGCQLAFAGHSPAVLDILDLTDTGGFFGDPLVIRKAAPL